MENHVNYKNVKEDVLIMEFVIMANANVIQVILVKIAKFHVLIIVQHPEEFATKENVFVK